MTHTIRSSIAVVGMFAILAGLGIPACSANDASPASNPNEVGTQTQALCPVGPAFPSCYGHCGFRTCSPAFPDVCCSCDPGCEARGDCCCDFETACIPDDSCAGRCGDETPAPAGCFCDDLCMGFGDCCGDFEPLCWGWPITYGTSGADRAPALTVDGSRNVYLAAQVSAPYDFGAGTVAVDGGDVAVTRFDNLADAEWSRRLALGDGTEAQSVTLDSSSRLHVVTANASNFVPGGTIHQLNRDTGAVFWTASRQGRGFFDVVPKAGGGVLVSGSHWAGFVSGVHKAGLYDYSVSGATAIRAAPENNVVYRRVALDAAGNAYVPVWGSGFLAGDYWIASRVESFTATGARRWTRQVATFDALDVAVNPAGSYFVGTCGAGCLITPTGPAFVAVLLSYGLDVAGTSRFGTEFAPVSGDAAFVRAVFGPGSVLHVLGRTSGMLPLGGHTVGISGRTTLFVARFSASGTVLGVDTVARTVGAAATLVPRDLAVAPDGTRFVSGEYAREVEISNLSFSTAGDINGFVARL